MGIMPNDRNKRLESVLERYGIPKTASLPTDDVERTLPNRPHLPGKKREKANERQPGDRNKRG